MRVDDFDFELPEANIALRPAVPRDSARLLIANSGTQGELLDKTIGNLCDFLRDGDALVFNDTRVIPAQLEGVRRRGDAVAKIGATLHMRIALDRWLAFVRGAKKLKVGETVSFGDGSLSAVVAAKGEGGEVEFVFDVAGPDLDAALVRVGHIPLPPYIALKRPEDERDHTDYQTIYAREDGAVAAPTAGLHFTDEVFARLDAKGVSRHFVTLHVGAGTFLPVKVDDTQDHKMHSEIGTVSRQTAAALNQTRAAGGRIISVGTTSLRLLESATTIDGTIEEWSGATDIFITPGYKFRAVDVLMTNFHLPRSTLFMLVSAFAGFETMKAAYAHAIAGGYRFYSYGDSSLLFPKKTSER
ncbi:MAG: tRNA preQ1(34) S-adenosylmethionine ribosyltransferase-isomerase QueA [Rhizobiaceae bacterium]